MRPPGSCFLLIMSVVLAACSEIETAGTDVLSPYEEITLLKEKNLELETRLSQKEAETDSFFSAFNEIQAQLDIIKQKEQKILTASREPRTKAVEDQIIEDIRSIYAGMKEYQEKLEKLKRNADSGNKSLQETVHRLDSILRDKRDRIDTLENSLAPLKAQIDSLKKVVAVQADDITGKTKKLNKAFYIVGTLRELKRKGVVTREGGFIGIGKSERMTKELQTDAFKEIDITQTPEIPLDVKELKEVKKARLLTSHPAGSFEFAGSKGKLKLAIRDAEKFWSTSKYIVVIVE